MVFDLLIFTQESFHYMRLSTLEDSVDHVNP